MWIICTLWLFLALAAVMYGSAKHLMDVGRGSNKMIGREYLSLVFMSWVCVGIVPVLIVTGLAKVLFS